MTVEIKIPQGLHSSSLPFKDIVRVENRSFSFFNVCTYQLYITIKNSDQEELFSLFSYEQEKDMQLAYDTIASLINQSLQGPITLEMVPMLA